MSDKLNQSLDEILKTRHNSTRRNKPARRSNANGNKPTPAAAPVGGVKKNTKPTKAGEKGVPHAPAPPGDSKIVVSNLPLDVTETQIKDYFNKTIGPVKKVLLTYGPNGQSRGVSTVIFSRAGSAAEAARDLDGVKVDKKPMKIEVIVTAAQVPAPPAPKALGDRITAKPRPAAKAQPKPATATKAAATKAGPKGRRGGRARNPGRGKPKTADELDAEMKDYFQGDATGAPAAEGADGDAAMANGGAVQPIANGGDASMDDENIN